MTTSASTAQRRFAVECGVGAAGAAGWVAWLGVADEGTAATLSNVGLAVVAMVAGLACLNRAGRASGRYGLVWRLLGASATSWGMGQVAWYCYENILGIEVPFPSVADVGYLLAIPLACAAMMAVPLSAQSVAGRLRTLLDGLMIAASLLLISWIVVLGPTLRTSGDDWLGQLISLAYPVGDVIAITCVLYVLLRSRQSARRPPIPLAFIGGALSALAAADSGFVYLTATGAYTSGNFIDVGWFLGYVAIALAARRPPGDQTATEPEEVQLRPLGLLLPYVAVIAAIVTSIVEIAGSDRLADTFVFWARSAIILMLVARQILTLLENLSLTKHLETRVAERTAELRASEQRFQALVLHSSDVVTIVDQAGVVLYQSESLQRVFGWPADAICGRPLSLLLEPAGAASLAQALEISAREPFSLRVVELQFRHREGRLCHAEVTITNLLHDPSVGGIVLNTRDISERKALADELAHQAFHDSLTGLANRALFKDRVRHALVRSEGRGVAVLFLDLDGFKQVNDSLGHAAGDQLLEQVADRLQRQVRAGDTVARFGGDEFAVLLEDALDELDAERVAEHVLDSLRAPFSIDGKEIHVNGSLGIAASGSQAQDTDQLLRNADLAMYRAKATGEGGFEVFDPEMHTHLVARLDLEADLRRALEQGQLVLHYQPTVQLSSGRMAGAEALVRWQHPVRELIMPSQFIGLAEETGLIERLGHWVLNEACRRMADWHQVHPDLRLSLSLNLSGRQLRRADLVTQVETALAESGLAPGLLTLEMTESVLMEHTRENLELLRRLKDLGVRLAIDDFGTGYSSLSYLHRFPVDVLKIDRSFVERLGDPRQDAELVRTIVGLGRTLGMETVAEGIENHHQFLALRRLGCDLGQGFYFSPAVPPDDFHRLLSQERGAERPGTPALLTATEG